MVEEARAKYSEITTWLFTPDPDLPNPDRIGWWWRRSRELAGIDERWRLHDLRHWSATEAIASGQDVRTVADRLGHADPAMTLRVYAHAVRAADEALAGILGRPSMMGCARPSDAGRWFGSTATVAPGGRTRG